jgi:hypothetical protein
MVQAIRNIEKALGSGIKKPSRSERPNMEVARKSIVAAKNIKKGENMHIPDGFLPLWESGIFWLISLAFVAMSLKWASKEMDEKTVPLFAALAAGIFAIQAMNMPIPWGTSGHMVGSAMTAIIFDSPWAGVLMLTLVLIVKVFSLQMVV